LNPRPRRYERPALTTELTPQKSRKPNRQAVIYIIKTLLSSRVRSFFITHYLWLWLPYAVNFKPIIDTSSKIIKLIRAKVAGSLNNIMPAIAAPTIPMPTHTA
jgi:hypothetical protein